ncbi:MAG: hypothetical protein WKF60_02530 [Ilumatobacter sp.]
MTDNIVYDIVSIQYHALQAQESCARYLDDVHNEQHTSITDRIKECRE